MHCCADKSVYKYDGMKEKLSKLESYALGYKGLFEDKRLFDGFLGTLQGIIGSKSLKVNQIASHSSILGTSQHAERRVRRLVHNKNSRAKMAAEDLTKTLTTEGSKRLAGEHEILLMMDESDLRKPFSRCIEHLDTVRSLEGVAVAGFHTLNVLAIGQSGIRAIVYHHSFSTLEPGFKSVSDEHKKAIDAVTKALKAQGVGRLLWVMDRGFDDLKVMRQIHNLGDCFLIRVQHMKRKCLHRNRPSKFSEALIDAPVLANATLEKRLIDPSAKRHKNQHVPVTLSAIEVELSEALGIGVCLTQVNTPNSKGWVLVSNLRLKDGEEEALLIRHLQLYRQRWSVEDLFAWSKDVLGWETVQLMSFDALKTLVAFAWIAAAFLYDLGADDTDESVQFLVKLGASHSRAIANPTTLAAGLKQLTAFLVVSQQASLLNKETTLDALIHDFFP